MNRVILAGVLSVAALMAQPQAQSPASAQDDPPSRVARLNWVSGDVAFQPATVDAWSNATVNYPLTTGDHLFVNPGGRAELHVGGNAIRLNANTNFGFLNLDDSIVQMSLNQGSLELRLRQLDQNDSFEIDTPNGAVTLLRAGEYRIDADPNRNSTMVTVRSGQAEMYQDGNSLLITPHQTVYFRDDRGPEVDAELGRDDFDVFATARNNAEDALPRRDYMPDSMIGSEDLYAYGRWGNDPLYGWIWSPPVDAGWSPYSTGRWAFVEPWGWTWVDDAPWGFAPFHYGRWVTVRGGWGWIPGARTYRPVYAPALVGFIGGGGFGISVGWFPLGPREPWIPAWGASRGYVNRVNVMHVTNINVINVNVTNINYVNRQNVTAVSRADFAGARPVRGAAVRLSPEQVRGAQVLGSGPQVAPQRGSVAIGPSRAAPAVSTHVVVARTPPPPAPVSFQARQQMLTQNNGQPLRSNQVEQLRSQQPAAVVQRAPVRQIGSPQTSQPMQQGRGAGQGGGNRTPAPAGPPVSSPAAPNRIPERMNSRPPGNQPQAAPVPAGQSQPIRPTPQQQPAPQPAQEAQPQRGPRQQNVPQQQQAAPAPPVQSRPVQPAPQPVQEAQPQRGPRQQNVPQQQQAAPAPPVQSRPVQPAPQQQPAPQPQAPQPQAPQPQRGMQGRPQRDVPAQPPAQQQQAAPAPPVQSRPVQPAPQQQPAPQPQAPQPQAPQPQRGMQGRPQRDVPAQAPAQPTERPAAQPAAPPQREAPAPRTPAPKGRPDPKDEKK